MSADPARAEPHAPADHFLPVIGVTIEEGAMSGFRILTCHSTRAGRASITVVDASTGATIVVSGLPFDHDYAESQAQVCRRIGNEAAPVLASTTVMLARPARVE